MEIGNVVKLKEKSLYYQMYEHDTFEIEKDWDKKHWVIRGLGPIAFLWLIIPKNEIEVIVYTYNEKKLLELYKRLNNLYEKLYSMELSELSLNSNYYEIEIIKLKQQIKELENE